MASNSEYEQRRSFESKKFYETGFFKKEYVREIPVTFDSSGMFVVDSSKVSDNWNYSGEVDVMKKELDNKCAEIVKIVKPKHEPRIINVKI